MHATALIHARSRFKRVRSVHGTLHTPHDPRAACTSHRTEPSRADCGSGERSMVMVTALPGHVREGNAKTRGPRDLRNPHVPYHC